MYLLAMVGTLMLIQTYREKNLQRKKFQLNKNYMNIIGFKDYQLE